MYFNNRININIHLCNISLNVHREVIKADSVNFSVCTSSWLLQISLRKVAVFETGSLETFTEVTPVVIKSRKDKNRLASHRL